MPLVLNHPDLKRLAKNLAERCGEQLEQAVLTALRERLERLAPTPERLRLAAEQLREDYEQDSELTAFTALDGEPFYEKG